jgi:hypothetical protein
MALLERVTEAIATHVKQRHGLSHLVMGSPEKLLADANTLPEQADQEPSSSDPPAPVATQLTQVLSNEKVRRPAALTFFDGARQHH